MVLNQKGFLCLLGFLFFTETSTAADASKNVWVGNTSQKLLSNHKESASSGKQDPIEKKKGVDSSEQSQCVEAFNDMIKPGVKSVNLNELNSHLNKKDQKIVGKTYFMAYNVKKAMQNLKENDYQNFSVISVAPDIITCRATNPKNGKDIGYIYNGKGANNTPIKDVYFTVKFSINPEEDRSDFHVLNLYPLDPTKYY